MNQEEQTVAVVDQQLVAYNNRDIEAFAATYHQEVEISSLSEGLLYSGVEELKARYGAKFAGLTYLKGTSMNRMVSGQCLVDYELAESSTREDRKIDQSIEVIVAYQIENGLIRRVTFMR